MDVLFAALSIGLGVVVAALLILAVVRDERRPISPLEGLLDDGVDWDAELEELVRSEQGR